MIALFILVFLKMTPCVQAKSLLTLESAIEEGLLRSPQIQKSKAQVEEAAWKRSEILGLGFLPKLSVSGTHYLATQYSISIISTMGNFPGFYPITTLSADISIPLFDGLANVIHLNAAGLNEEAVRKEASYAEFQLKKEIQLAFHQALAAEQLYAVAEENVRTLEEHLHQVKTQQNGGSATQYDVLRVEVQLSDGKADAIDSQDVVVLARRKLTQFMGLEADVRSIRGVLPIPNEARVKTLKEEDILSVREDIQALDLRTDAANRFRTAKKLWAVPVISLGGQYLLYDQQQVNFATSGVSNTGNFQSAYNVGLFLKWNLFDGGVSVADANQLGAQEVIVKKNAEIAKIAVPYDFEYWKRRYLSNTDHYLSKKFDIQRSQESVRLAREEERAGSRTSTETLDAELDLFRARAGAITSQVNASEAQIRLELVLGRNI